ARSLRARRSHPHRNVRWQHLPAYQPGAAHHHDGAVRLFLFRSAMAMTEDNESTRSDVLLRQLMAVGQVDVLVGLPTLNNASTIVDIVRAIHVSFTRDFPRLRTVMINSDGGSTDGTPELVRAASLSHADMLQTS